MAVIDQKVTDRYAIYHGDCIDVMKVLPDDSVHVSIYSPPFRGLYHYTSSPRDLSNNLGSDEFFKHYEFAVREIERVTIPGRMTGVHCSDIPFNRSGIDVMYDLGGDIIRLHQRLGWHYIARYAVWKEPLAVRNRTMAKKLAHRTIVDDSSRCSVAAADWLLIFRKKGDNPIPITHPNGLIDYAGSREIPIDLLPYRGYSGRQIYNLYSHWIWRQYASAFWDDVRVDRVLPFRPAKDRDDESHIHPLQLDVIDRILVLWSNVDEVVLTPFMGIGSEVYAALCYGRKGIGIELKETYYQQAVRNIESAIDRSTEKLQGSLSLDSSKGGEDEDPLGRMADCHLSSPDGY